LFALYKVDPKDLRNTCFMQHNRDNLGATPDSSFLYKPSKMAENILLLHRQKRYTYKILFMGWYLWTYHFISFNVNYRNALFSTNIHFTFKRKNLSCSQVPACSSKNGETLPIKLTDTTSANHIPSISEKYPNNCYVPNRLTH
jgi:hypothetical protein